MKTIVGMHQGENLGVVIFSLSQKEIKNFTARRYEMRSLLEYIEKFGKPCAVVLPYDDIPEVAESIAKHFDIPILVPDKELSKREISLFARRFEFRTEEEKMAIAGVAYLFKKYSKTFEEIEKILKNMGMNGQAEYAKELVIRGSASSAFEAVEKSVKLPVEEAIKKREREIIKEEDDAEVLKKKLEEARRHIKSLEENLKILEEERRMLLSSQSRDGNIKNLLEKINALERENIKLKEEIREERRKRKVLEDKLYTLQEEKFVERQGYIPVIKINEGSYEEISGINEKIGIFKKIVAIESELKEKEAKYLAALKPSLVIAHVSEEMKPIFVRSGIPVIDFKEIPGELIPFNRFYGLSREAMKKIERETGKKTFMDWLKGYKERKI